MLQLIEQLPISLYIMQHDEHFNTWTKLLDVIIITCDKSLRCISLASNNSEGVSVSDINNSSAALNVTAAVTADDTSDAPVDDAIAAMLVLHSAAIRW
jgi:hypothetical protein